MARHGGGVNITAAGDEFDALKLASVVIPSNDIDVMLVCSASPCYIQRVISSPLKVNTVWQSTIL